MIVVKDIEQGTPEWHALRLGIPTASCFDRIVTPSGGRSSQFDAYLAECIGEWVTGEQASDWSGNIDTERGHLFESDARATYAWETGFEVEEVGFIYKDADKRVGASPDGLVKPSARHKKYTRGVEIKCPRGVIHVGYLYLNECPKKYLPQTQGSIWVSGLDQWDFMSYHQAYDPLIVTVERDEKFSKVLDKAIPEFVERLQQAMETPRFIEMREMRLEAAA